jgi:hypothetical protein
LLLVVTMATTDNTDAEALSMTTILTPPQVRTSLPARKTKPRHQTPTLKTTTVVAATTAEKVKAKAAEDPATTAQVHSEAGAAWESMDTAAMA